jgi:Spy/CpxP family protein refolding chaperone
MRRVWIVLAAGLLVACTVAAAQDAERPATPRRVRPRPGSGAGPLGRAIAQLTDLTDEQKAKLDKLRADFRAKMADLRKAETPDRAAIRKLIQEHRQAELAVLTDAQRKKVEELMPRPRRGRVRGGPGTGRGPLGRAIGELEDLTDEQKAKLDKLRTEFRTKYDALRKQMQDLLTGHRKDEMAVLTDAQRKKVEQRMAEIRAARGRRAPRAQPPATE